MIAASAVPALGTVSEDVAALRVVVAEHLLTHQRPLTNHLMQPPHLNPHPMHTNEEANADVARRGYLCQRIVERRCGGRPEVDGH